MRVRIELGMVEAMVAELREGQMAGEGSSAQVLRDTGRARQRLTGPRRVFTERSSVDGSSEKRAYVFLSRFSMPSSFSMLHIYTCPFVVGTVHVDRTRSPQKSVSVSHAPG